MRIRTNGRFKYRLEVLSKEANTSKQKYHKLIEWRRNIIKHLLVRGYPQYDLFLDVQNTLAGLAQLIKKSWTIVDDPKIDQKEKMKAISLILQCYNKRLDLLNFEPEVNELREILNIHHYYLVWISIIEINLGR